jgi:hypothetical protein
VAAEVFRRERFIGEKLKPSGTLNPETVPIRYSLICQKKVSSLRRSIPCWFSIPVNIFTDIKSGEPVSVLIPVRAQRLLDLPDVPGTKPAFIGKADPC